MIDGGELVPLHTEFDVVFRGYRRGPVREYVRGVEAELRLLAADRDANAELARGLAAEVEQLRAENVRLRRRLDQAVRAPIEPDVLQHRMRRMVELANEEAGEITARAQAAAENCWATAQDAAGRLRVGYEESIADVDRTRKAMAVEHRALLQQARADATTMTTEADRRRHELDNRAARRREHIKTDFEVAMAARRTDAMRAIAEQREAARAEAERLVNVATEQATTCVKEANDEAARLVGIAQKEVARLRDLRGRLATQLTGARDVLTGAGPLLAPVTDEEDLTAIPRQRERAAQLATEQDAR